MKDCPSPGEMPLSRSAPSTDFAAALEVGLAIIDLCTDIMRSPIVMMRLSGSYEVGCVVLTAFGLLDTNRSSSPCILRRRSRRTCARRRCCTTCPP